MIQKTLQFIRQRKITAGAMVLTLILVGHYGYKTLTDTSQKIHYALAAVTKGTIITSITGSGQVSVSNQVDIKPKVAGDVIYVGVKNGQKVKTGALLAQLDSHDAQKAVRDAQISLENAQIGLSKLQISQKMDAPKLQDAITSARNNLNQAYQNGFNETANSFLDLPNILTGIRGIIYDAAAGSPGQINTGAYQDLMDQANKTTLMIMINQAISDYLVSTEKYNKNLDDYKNTTRYSESAQISSLIDETLETAKTMAQSAKDEQNILDTVTASLKQYQSARLIPQAITQYQSDISAYIGKLNGHITGLTNIQNSITSNQQSLASAQRESEASLAGDPLDIASQENAVKQRQAALADTQDKLADYFIRAPFGGVVAKINVIRGDSVSGGVTVATIITNKQIAEISLNEVDVAQVKIGQKATLSFDAVPNLTLTGELSEIDAVGTITQGVVTYNAKIVFDTQDERIKPGMSVSAAIITDTKQDVLLVPNSAVKSQGETSYVEMPADAAAASQLLAAGATSAGVLLVPAPLRQIVELGLANDSVTEIVGGLKEGDLVITRTIASTSGAAQSTQSRSLFQLPGARSKSSGNSGTRILAH